MAGHPGISTTENKVKYHKQGNVILQLLIRPQDKEKVEIEDLLTPVPYSRATADGFLTKTDKAKSLHHLTKDIENTALPLCETTLMIEDDNALFHYLREVPGNFKHICQKPLAMPVKT